MKKSTQVLKAVCIVLFAILTTQPTQAKWDKKTNIITPFSPGRWGAQIFTIEGKIFVSGGYADNNANLNDMVSYDPQADSWKFLNNLPGATNRSGGIAFTINGKAYLGLGIENFNNFMAPWAFLQDLWEYNPTDDTWTKKADFPGAGVGFAGTFVVNNKVYVVGGQNGKFSADGVNEVYEYDPAKDKWTKKENFPETLVISPCSFSMNGKGYIVGGVKDGSTNSNKTYEYDPATDKWTQKANYPEAEINAGIAFVANNKAYCGLGRLATSKYLDYFWAYSPDTDSWTYAPGFEFGGGGRMFGIAVLLDNKIYAGGGWKVDGSVQTYFLDWYSIDPVAALDVATVEHNSKLKVYPNPATNVLQFNADNKYNTYNLYSISGKLVATGTTKSANTIDVSTFNSGHYILQLKGANNSVQRAVTIK